MSHIIINKNNKKILHLIQSVFILLTAFYLLPNTILAIDSCSTVSGCPTGDASLGVNFTGIQSSDLSAGSFTVSLSSSQNFSCSYSSGTAGNSGSCTASYDGSNISCQINHLDCRNQPFTVSVSTPTGAGYACTASTNSVNLNNCSNNTPITVNCTPPVNPIFARCYVNNDINDVTINTGDAVTWSTSNPTGGTGTYSYSWSGTDSLSGTSQSVAKTYNTAGTQTASVTITSGSQSLILDYADCPTVTVNSPPPTTKYKCVSNVCASDNGDGTGNYG
ncbi:hypothetical protein HYW41_04885 [Candidatus Daviesbacteria bacterium]|nr:hypothetical protein [Candidatus Daviesbacteria bacterium]